MKEQLRVRSLRAAIYVAFAHRPLVNSSLGSTAVTSGNTATFAVTPSSGFGIDRITGCGEGSFAASAYTTAPITGACTVTVTFREVPTVDVNAPLVKGGRGALDWRMLVALSMMLVLACYSRAFRRSSVEKVIA